MENLIDNIIVGSCILAIVAGSIFGTWALLVTMSL